ncbi:Cation efflux system protein CusB precursor [Novipirellula galeiformis]|uniref:Cation efflux system protein CusB n=1 Tax=Novipirellula galeiformis TaxID=2528004 RepID=A0A5C6CEF0_9BACT|nr:efflux RND transporter periplasmic adaptor subunit [Novipirellula galeiformis]TWU22395.1 Cation efflux system protein CusB precursor [Novipirellula galeiformis]
MNHWLTRHRKSLWIAQAIAFVLLGFAVASWFGGGSQTPTAVSTSTSHDVSAPSKPAIWTCSMHPQIRRDGPGDCPICGMDLVPVRESAGGIRTVSISDAVKKLMKVETVPVQRRYVTAEVRMVGKLQYDETRLAHITAWVSGRLERMFVDYTGVNVNQGDHMVQLYSEELYTGQEELIAATESAATSNRSSRFIQPIDLAESAREKLRRLGMTKEQIQEIEQRRTPSESVTIYSPVGGIVVKKLKQEGERVQTGDRIYTVADLSQLWVQLDAYESDLAWLRYGQQVQFTTEAYPGEIFRGQIAFIDPVLNADTRTVRVRVNVSNEDGRLKPEMFVRAIVESNVAAGGRVLDASLAGKWISPMHPEIVKDEPGNCDICGMPLVRAETLGYVTAEPSDTAKPLVVPVSAVLLTGTRAIVYIQIPDADKPTYEGREIVIGARAGDSYLVKSGLREGELVVIHGNFKLDSALQISAKPSMMTPQGGGGSTGHHHGNESPTPLDSSIAMSGHAMSLPPAFVTAAIAVVDQYETLRESLEAADLQAIQANFVTLGEKMASVPPANLSPELSGLWRELAMLLQNDSVEGRDVQSMRDADRVFAVTRRHIEQLKNQFALSMDDDEPAVEVLDAPQAVVTQIKQLVPIYLAISEALAADESEHAKQSVSKLHDWIAATSAVEGSGKAIERWTKERRDLSEITARLSKANDLETLRSSFALLSEQMLSLQRMFGLPASQSLYELHCPMAFDGRGASWIQSDDAVRNPYYGASMLKCADRIEKLEARGESK